MKTRAMTIPGQTTNMVDGPATFLELLHLSVWPLALSLFPASGLVIPFAAAPGLHLASGLVSHATRNDNSNKARECCQERSEKILFSTPFSPFFLYSVETNMQGKLHTCNVKHIYTRIHTTCFHIIYNAVQTCHAFYVCLYFFSFRFSDQNCQINFPDQNSIPHIFKISNFRLQFSVRNFHP